MATTPRTPADLVIHPRNVTFPPIDTSKRWWNAGDPVATAYFNSLSVTFPPGETFFIRSVRNFRNAVPAALKAQIDDFIRQEAVHSREHASFNEQAKNAGYDVSAIEEEVAGKLAMTKDNPPIVNLAMTVALEHFTAILAHASLNRKDHMPGVAPEIGALWKWHAIEEIEHKAVAFDTFLAVTQNVPRFKRWALRSFVMWRVSTQFVIARTRNMRVFFEQDGINTFATRLRTFNYLWIYPGILRRIIPSWLAFFRPGFHPWDIDDRALVRKHEVELQAIPSYNEGLAANAAR
jgi:predicted metal-dependent hydrolase